VNSHEFGTTNITLTASLLKSVLTQVVFDHEAAGQLRALPGDLVTFCIPEVQNVNADGGCRFYMVPSYSRILRLCEEKIDQK